MMRARVGGSSARSGRLQEFVAARLAGGDGPDPLVTEAVRRLLPGRTADVTSIGSELYVSERQFRRRCQSTVGLAPKALHRMLRFQGFLAQAQYVLAQGRDPAGDGLARLAVGAGYADQSHLTGSACGSPATRRWRSSARPGSSAVAGTTTRPRTRR